MEDKIRKYLEELANKQVNLTSEFAREQMTADIMRIVEKYPAKSWDAGKQQRLEIATRAMQALIKLNPACLQNISDDSTPVPMWTADKALEYTDALLKQEEK